MLGAAVEQGVGDLESSTLQAIVEDGVARPSSWIETAQERDVKCPARTQHGGATYVEQAIRAITDQLIENAGPRLRVTSVNRKHAWGTIVTFLRIHPPPCACS